MTSSLNDVNDGDPTTPEPEPAGTVDEDQSPPETDPENGTDD
jgi:hypothetical protein